MPISRRDFMGRSFSASSGGRDISGRHSENIAGERRGADSSNDRRRTRVAPTPAVAPKLRPRPLVQADAALLHQAIRNRARRTSGQTGSSRGYSIMGDLFYGGAFHNNRDRAIRSLQSFHAGKGGGADLLGR